MQLDIDTTETPAQYGLTDNAPALEIYANEQFDTNDGKTVMPGDPERGDFRHRVVGSVAASVITFPKVEGIYSTEDSLTNQLATYSAYIRITGQPLIPWLERFPLPTLPQGQASWSWTRLRIHAAGVLARHSAEVYTKTQTNQAIAAALLQGGTVAASGLANLADGAVLVPTTAVLITSKIGVFSMDEFVTGNLRAPAADIVSGVSFMIRSTNPGDNGVVSWFIVN